MAPSLRPDDLRRYAQLTRLLVRHGNVAVLDRGGLESAIGGALDDGEGSRGGDPEGFARDLEAMGATYVKLGQLLSTRADLLPDDYLDALERLQDAVEPMPAATVRQVIEGELEVRLTKLFPQFEAQPLASASLGQVHQARLRDGTAVAVKVQRPDVRAEVDRDLQLLEDLAGLLDRTTDVGERFRFSGIVDEFRRSLVRELDYRREAQHLVTLGENLSRYETIVVPAPVQDLTTSRVLVMQLVSGRKVTALSPLRHLDLDGIDLADDLFRAYLQQILADGFVHADPHPGNVFVTDDHRLALLDLGMVVRLQPDLRELLLRLLLAVAEGDTSGAADAAIAIGEAPEHFAEARFRREVADLVGTYLDLPPEDLRIGRIVLRLSRISGDTGLRPPAELSLLGRTLVNLDAVGRALAPTFEPNAAIKRIAAEVATQSAVETLTPSNLVRAALDAKELAESLPGRVNRVTEQLADGRFTVQVDALDERFLMRAVQKVANRVTLGLVIAALIVGAAMLMRVETDATLLGYPALAMVCFTLAALGGVALIVTILVGDERRD